MLSHEIASHKSKIVTFRGHGFQQHFCRIGGPSRAEKGSQNGPPNRGSVIKNKSRGPKLGAIFGPQILHVWGLPNRGLGGDMFSLCWMCWSVPRACGIQAFQSIQEAVRYQATLRADRIHDAAADTWAFMFLACWPGLNFNVFGCWRIALRGGLAFARE